MTLVDTAGLRETDDALEASGVAIARKRAENADLVLALYCEGEPGAGIAVRTKSDLGGDGTGIAVSSTTGAGINDLENRLRDWATCTASPAAAGLLAQHRVHAAVTRARGELADAAYRLDPVLQAEALRLAIRALGEITGANDVEAVLDAIFARFCIGK